MTAKLPDKYRYIVIEGPIGAGKTSLARLLSQHTGGEALLEDPDANPFLPGFYQDRARYALPTQLYFLFQRATQLRALSQPDLFAGNTIADFMIDKDSLFARLTLSDDEYALYRQVYAQLKPQAPAPDLVDLPSGLARDADRPRAPPRRRLRARHPGRVPGAVGGNLCAVLLPVRRGAGADRQFR